ncbi:ATP synthase F1 subunit gamma [Peptococcaceae bacterium 1198_IL3148]
MANARDIRRRIKSVKNTQQITKAMKVVAAAKLRRAQEAATSARPFTKKLSQVMGRVSSAAGGVNHPLLEVREAKKTAYIIVTADSGLCGGFNANIIRQASAELKQYDQPALVTVGRKGRDFFRRQNAEIVAEYVNLGDSISFGRAKEIANYVIDKYTAGEFDEVYLLFNEFVNVLTQRPKKVKLLPIESFDEEGAAEKAAGQEKKASVSYMFEPSAESVLGELLPKYIEVSIFEVLLESKAGELGARMTAMDSATNNAKDLIDSLTLSLNRARQAAITTEISEIVSGAAALG